MSATEVIEEIKKLPTDEQKKVLDFVHALEGALEGKESSFEASAKWALEEHRELLRRLAQ
ncbi:MAG: hypothetical protein H0X66_13590 [Verrucomicrobia bacterium]|nr:hypothetical protein [Verrucomicrobiota bacterium]